MDGKCSEDCYVRKKMGIIGRARVVEDERMRSAYCLCMQDLRFHMCETCAQISIDGIL